MTHASFARRFHCGIRSLRGTGAIDGRRRFARLTGKAMGKL